MVGDSIGAVAKFPHTYFTFSGDKETLRKKKQLQTPTNVGWVVIVEECVHQE
jgi:hypothetical protein